MSIIAINSDVIKEVNHTGASVNEVLEKECAKELSEKRAENTALKSLSATKIALLDAGVDGSCIVDKLFTTTDSEYLFPAYITDLMDTTMQESDVMQHMVTGETGVDSLVLKTPTLDLLSAANKAALKKARVTEGADIPVRKITIGSKSVELYKKAIAISQTYESARYTRIDLFSKMLKAVAADIVGQNIDEIVKTLEACSLQALKTTATANTVTADELFDACLAYTIKYGYAPTTVVANEDMFKSIAKITYNTNNAFGANEKLKINVPQLDNMQLSVIRADVAQISSKNVSLIYNKDKSITRFIANGSNITEAKKNIENQTELATMSEISGYGALIESVGKITSA